MENKKNIPTFAIVVLVVLITYLVSLSLPMIWGIYTSLKDSWGFIVDPVWPSFELSFENYVQAFEQFFMQVEKEVDGVQMVKTVYYEEMMLNSIIYAVGS